MAERMAKILMRAIKIEGISNLREHLHPRKILIGLIGFVAVARTLRWLIITQNAWRFVATDFASDTRFGRIASVRERAYFSLGLNRICTFYRVYKWNIIINSLLLNVYIIIDINKIYQQY